MSARGGFTVSGPGVDRNGYQVALSAAITFAGRAQSETTLYVRDAAGEAHGRVERAGDGSMKIYAKGGRTNG